MAVALPVGLEYEAKLYGLLEAAGISFWTEESLRSLGSVKTPDAKLQVLLGVTRGLMMPFCSSLPCHQCIAAKLQMRVRQHCVMWPLEQLWMHEESRSEKLKSVEQPKSINERQ